MAEYRTEQLRTVALVGHGASGKTTLAEALLARAGMVSAAGSVERGTTASDFDPLEKDYLHSLASPMGVGPRGRDGPLRQPLAAGGANRGTALALAAAGLGRRP